MAYQADGQQPQLGLWPLLSVFARFKKFLGNSENAVKTQIWSAVTTYVLIAIVKEELQLNASLYTLLQLLSVSVFDKTEVSSALQLGRNSNDNADNDNQLNSFNF